LNAIAALAAVVMDRRAFLDTDLAQHGDLFLATRLKTSEILKIKIFVTNWQLKNAKSWQNLKHGFV
jgi:hypothetical protein